MASFFSRKKTRTPPELVALVIESIAALGGNVDGGSSSVAADGGNDGGANANSGVETDPGKRAKIQTELTSHVIAMRTILLGDEENEVQPELMGALAHEIYAAELLSILVSNLMVMEFDCRKDVAIIFNSLLRYKQGTTYLTVEHVCNNPAVMDALVAGYAQIDVALSCGSMLRECIEHEVLARMLLYSSALGLLFRFVEVDIFDIASDAFLTLKVLLTTHAEMAAEFMELEYDAFFSSYSHLLDGNYLTRRQSLKLLGEILLDRSNFRIMVKFIGDAGNLKTVMKLLRDKHKNIQFEAFHVFKVFVANPNKSQPVHKILYKNKEKMLTFLADFQSFRGDDEQFMDERAFLMEQIEDLGPPPPPAADEEAEEGTSTAGSS